MRVIVKFFATYREVAGEPRTEIELERKATLGDALDVVFERYPKLKKWSDSIVCSVNREYAEEDRVLEEGDEIALLPPVSGGGRMSGEEPSIEEMFSALKTKDTGAVVLFVGVVRKDPGVKSIMVEGYPEMVEEKLEGIIRASKERFDIERMEILHKTGKLGIGEKIVLIGASASHRKDAFEACRWAIDELKRSVPIWKKDQGGWVGQDD